VTSLVIQTWLYHWRAQDAGYFKMWSNRICLFHLFKA